MNRLTVGDTESVKGFKRTIRQMMEVFLRFTHRYWFHEVSNQALARSVFGRITKHLGTDEIYNEVRNEVIDMNSYLDSDSARRQANTVLRLTVVTILGLIGTVASGLLGMNLLDETQRSVPVKVIVFVVVLLGTFVVTIVTVAKSKRLADILDTISDERLGWKGRWRALWETSHLRRRLKRK
jgi:Mg2+ and Co2+ transporter CorA